MPVQEANRVKTNGTRMLAVGVGVGPEQPGERGPADADRRPAGRPRRRPGNLDSLNDVDVALVTDFKKLAAFMRGVVIQLCSPSLDDPQARPDRRRRRPTTRRPAGT